MSGKKRAVIVKPSPWVMKGIAQEELINNSMEGDTSEGEGNGMGLEINDELQQGDMSSHFFRTGHETSSQNEKLRFYADFKARGIKNFKISTSIYISPLPVGKFSLQDFVTIRPLLCLLETQFSFIM